MAPANHQPISTTQGTLPDHTISGAGIVTLGTKVGRFTVTASSGTSGEGGCQDTIKLIVVGNNEHVGLSGVQAQNCGIRRTNGNGKISVLVSSTRAPYNNPREVVFSIPESDYPEHYPRWIILEDGGEIVREEGVTSITVTTSTSGVVFVAAVVAPGCAFNGEVVAVEDDLLPPCPIRPLEHVFDDLDADILEWFATGFGAEDHAIDFEEIFRGVRVGTLWEGEGSQFAYLAEKNGHSTLGMNLTSTGIWEFEHGIHLDDLGVVLGPGAHLDKVSDAINRLFDVFSPDNNFEINIEDYFDDELTAGIRGNLSITHWKGDPCKEADDRYSGKTVMNLEPFVTAAIDSEKLFKDYPIRLGVNVPWIVKLGWPEWELTNVEINVDANIFGKFEFEPLDSFRNTFGGGITPLGKITLVHEDQEKPIVRTVDWNITVQTLGIAESGTGFAENYPVTDLLKVRCCNE